MIIGQEKPSLEECIEHFGIKGMRWGKRKSVPSEPSKDPPRIYRTHLPTQEQLLSEHPTSVMTNPTPQVKDPAANDVKNEVNRMVIHAVAITAAGAALSHGPQMKTAYKFIKNSPRMLRGKKVVSRQGRSLLHKIGRLPLHSLTPVKGSIRMIVKSLNESRA
jgi:hypothetical protein